MRFLLVLFTSFLLTAPCFGQIKLTEEKIQTWTGFENPIVVNGTITAGPNSKPVLSSITTTIKVETAIDYKFTQMKGRKIPGLTRITLEATDFGYQFKPGTPPGTYQLEYLAFDPEKGIASEEITVELKEIGPTPTPPLPEDPEDPLEGLAGETRAVVVNFVQDMANNYKILSNTSSEFQTVTQAATKAVALDLESRNKFKDEMGKIMKPALGSDVLPANVSDIFNQISLGFGSIK